jgi:signal peptidase I
MKKFWNAIKDYVYIVIVVVLIRTFLVTPALVDGDSMNDNLYNNDLVIINKLVYRISDIKRFDIVVVNNISGNDKIIKRVIGLPNEKIEYKDKGALPLWRKDIIYDENGKEHTATEHSIGNLVLLYKDDNSKFSDADFQTKKNIFFETENVQTFKSRHLIHTISVFAHSNWDGEQIARNKKAIIDAFNDYYKKYEKNYLR